MYCVRKVNDDYTWVGADGRRLAMFEGVYDVPAGISFNSYLLRDEKTVLFDTADSAVSHLFLENVQHVLDGRGLDYVVVHHMEPDHSAELGNLLLRFPVFRAGAFRPHHRGEGGRHPDHRTAHAAICGGPHGALAGGADDLRPDR